MLAANVTLLVALGAATAPLVGRRSAAARHLVWAATLAGVLAFPALHVAGPRWTPRQVYVLAASTAAVDAARPATAGPEAVPSAPGAKRPLRAGRVLAPGVVAGGVALMWGFGAAAGFAAAIAGAVARRRLARGRPVGRAASDTRRAVQGEVRRLGAQLGVRRPVRLAWGPAGAMPMTWGVWRPVVLLPADAAAWPAAERDAVLRHELAHVRRGDAGWALVEELACAVFWFHPGVWLARAARVRWQERAADALAVATGADRHAYAAALVHAARRLARTPRRGWHAASAPALGVRVGLAERLRALTAPDFAPGTCPRGRRACVLVGVAASAVTLAALGRASATPRAATAGAAATNTTPGDDARAGARGRRPNGASTHTGGQPMAGGNPSGAEAGALPLTDDARRLLLEARDEADRLHHEYVGTEHLGLALTRRTGDAATAPLAHLGVDGDRVREALATVIGRGDSARAPAPGAARPYTTRTQTALRLAAEHARALGRPHVGTGDVLVGVMREERNILAQVLGHHGLTPEAVDAHVRQLGTGHGLP